MIGKTIGNSWFNSVTGIVKSYIRSRFDRDQQNNKDAEKLKSLRQISPMRSTMNNFAQSSIPALKTTSHVIHQNERNWSPDPPIRHTRGNQSPLILRKKLELASPKR